MQIMCSIAQSWSYHSTSCGREVCPKPDSQKWNRLLLAKMTGRYQNYPKLVTLRTPHSLMHLVLQSILPTKLRGSQQPLAVSASEHPKTTQDVLSGNQRGPAINGSMDWFQGKPTGNLGSETNPIIEWRIFPSISYACESLETSLAYPMALGSLPGRHFNTPPISKAWRSALKPCMVSWASHG